MTYPRFASYVASPDRCFWVTTMVWDSYWGPRPESGIRDLERTGAESFTLIQHDVWTLDGIHRAIVELLKRDLAPEQVQRAIYRGLGRPLAGSPIRVDEDLYLRGAL